MDYGKELKVRSDDWIRSNAIGQVLNGGSITRDGRIIPGGLYDKLIFGSDTTCNCFRNLRTPGTCSCGVTVYRTEDLANTFGFYESKIPVINFILLKTFIEKFASACKPIYNAISKVHGTSKLTLEHLWATTFSATEEETGIVVELNGGIKFNLQVGLVNENSPCRSIGLIGLKAISKGKITDCDTNWLSRNITTCIAIPQIMYRPYMMLYAQGEKNACAHPLTSNYGAMITVAEWMNYASPESFAYKNLEGGSINAIDFATLCYGFQSIYNQIMMQNSMLAPSKQSAIRALPRQRVTKTSRTTITADVDLPIDTVGIPMSLFYEANKVDIINKLTELYPEDDAISLYVTFDDKATKCARDMAQESCVCIERPPTLHKYNVLAFRIQLHEGITMKMNPLVCKPFNADFDGDQMSQWYITDPKLAESTMKKMSTRSFWVYEKNNKAMWQPTAQNLLGLFYLTNPNPIRKATVPSYTSLADVEKDFQSGVVDFDQLISVGAVESSYGRLKVSQLLNQDLDGLIGADKAINAGNISIIMSALYPLSDRLERLKVLQDLGLRAVTEIGVSFLTPTEMAQLSEGIDKNEEINAILKSDMPDGVKVNEIEKVVSTVIKERSDSIPALLDQISGSDKVTLKQLNEITMGKVTFKDGVPKYSNDSLIRGASERTYAEHAMTERKISALKQNLLPLSGYLSRQMVDSAEQIVFDSNFHDPNDIGVWIPSSQAVGRTDMNGKVITSRPTGERVRVKSFATSQSDYIGYDELRRDIFVYEDGAAPGKSILASIGEQLLQAGLELKHAGKLSGASDECFTCPFSGTITEITPLYFTISTTNGDKSFPLPTRYKPTKVFCPNTKVQNGDVLFYSANTISPDERFMRFASFIGAHAPGKKRRPLSLSVAIGDGEVEYNFNGGTITYNGVTSKLDKTAIYYCANGDKLKHGDIINSGILDISIMSKYQDVDEGERFYTFWLTFKKIWGDSALNCEYAEMMYHVLRKAGVLKPLQHILTQDLSFISSMNYGWNMKALTRFLDKDIGNSLLTEFLLEKK